MRAKLLVGLLVMVACTPGQTRDGRVEGPRFWNDSELADWALPVAGLNLQPAHFSEKDYYAAPNAERVRTYPVYFPGREPAGYWDMTGQRKPEPLIMSGPRAMAATITCPLALRDTTSRGGLSPGTNSD